MRQAPQAIGIDVTMAAAAAFNSKAIQDCDCRSSQWQKGRKAQLPRNIKAIGTVSSPIDTRYKRRWQNRPVDAAWSGLNRRGKTRPSKTGSIKHSHEDVFCGTPERCTQWSCMRGCGERLSSIR